jgi:hypothetical protein
MIVTATFDAKPFSLFLTDFERRQLPFATAVALNATADYAQQAVRQKMRRVFFMRSSASENWLLNQVRIPNHKRATKSRLAVTLDIDPAQGGKAARSSLLPMLEGGFLRSSPRVIGSTDLFARGSIAVPNRESPLSQIPRSLYPSSLGLQQRRDVDGNWQAVKVGRGARARQQWYGLKGKRRTFVVRTSAGRGLVLQRTGPGKEQVRTLFLIRPPAFVRPRAFFFDTAQEEFKVRILDNLRFAFAQAMETAR